MAKGCDEPRSLIPTHMKPRTKLEVSSGKNLVVKQHTMVFINQPNENPSGENEPMKDEDFDNHQEGFKDIASINHITVQVVKEPSLDDELEEAPLVFEEGG